MLSEYGTIVVGAGPAGLFCALNTSDRSHSVLLLEKTGSPGRKLLLSGSGQCNFSAAGPASAFAEHYGAAANFVKPALMAFTNEDLCAFLEAGGVGIFRREDGKLFPSGMRAAEILELLIAGCRENGVKTIRNSPVEAVCRDRNGFTVNAGGRVFSSDSLVIATGGCSYPETGSTGDGHSLAASLGHPATSLSPALTHIHAGEPFPRELAGISLKNARITLLKAGGAAKTAKGDVLFTGSGLSGPGILDLSRYIGIGDRIDLALTEIPSGGVDASLVDALQTGGKRTVRTILKGFGLPERLADAVLERAGIKPSRKAGDIARADRMKLSALLTSFPVVVESKGGFDVAMATAGGVSREGVNRRTMESRITPGLFFAGEVLDVDGDTGGYNIQWAFSSGWAAACGIRSRKPSGPALKKADITL